eukprot:jgi/Psemu1/14497/gm1.14497_g
MLKNSSLGKAGENNNETTRTKYKVVIPKLKKPKVFDMMSGKGSYVHQEGGATFPYVLGTTYMRFMCHCGETNKNARKARDHALICEKIDSLEKTKADEMGRIKETRYTWWRGRLHLVVKKEGKYVASSVACICGKRSSLPSLAAHLKNCDYVKECEREFEQMHSERPVNFSVSNCEADKVMLELWHSGDARVETIQQQEAGFERVEDVESDQTVHLDLTEKKHQRQYGMLLTPGQNTIRVFEPMEIPSSFFDKLKNMEDANKALDKGFKQCVGQLFRVIDSGGHCCNELQVATENNDDNVFDYQARYHAFRFWCM